MILKLIQANEGMLTDFELRNPTRQRVWQESRRSEWSRYQFTSPSAA
jgi:hypothetical protein